MKSTRFFRTRAFSWVKVFTLLLSCSWGLAHATTELTVSGNFKSVTRPTFDLEAKLGLAKTRGPAITLPEFAKLEVLRDNRKVTLKLDTDNPALLAVVYRYDDDNQLIPCSQQSFLTERIEIPVDQLRCLREETSKQAVRKGGILAVSDGTATTFIARLEYKQSTAIVGDDLGIAVNILNRSRDDQGFRFFEGASVCYSLSNLRTETIRVIANLSVLDFDPDTDFEAGLAFGLLYKPKATSLRATGDGFAISIAYGYNFMVDDSDTGWYTLIGFGWSFNLASR